MLSLHVEMLLLCINGTADPRGKPLWHLRNHVQVLESLKAASEIEWLTRCTRHGLIYA